MRATAHRTIADRPRERLLHLGATRLTEAQLIALILGPGRAAAAAEEILARFGGLAGLLPCHARELMGVPGVGVARACALVAAVELGRRLEAWPAENTAALSSSARAYRLIKGRLDRLKHEIFIVLALDAQNRLIAERQVAQGSATSVEVHPREVFSPLIREGAAATIVAHNHPSGDPEPSADDHLLTRRLTDAGLLLGIPLLDHLVVGHGRYVSFADRGLL